MTPRRVEGGSVLATFAYGYDSGGRLTTDDRACLVGIVYVHRNGVRWRDLPERFPSPVTCCRGHRDWSRAGVWERA
jgi:transposase